MPMKAIQNIAYICQKQSMLDDAEKFYSKALILIKVKLTIFLCLQYT